MKGNNNSKEIEMMWKKHINCKKIACLIFYILIVLLSLMFICASRWSFYSADDFNHSNSVGVFHVNILELFRASVRYMTEVYKNWQGTYFSMFLQGFLSPINGLGEGQLAVVMVCNVILFILTLLLLIREICSIIGMEKHLKALLCLFVVFSILGFKAWTEIFYWFSGAVSYSFPLSFAMLAITLFIKNKNTATYVVACILSFLACGGSLEVAGAHCFGILTILVVKGFKNCGKLDYLFFGISVAGAVINTAAPGNYARHDVIDDSGLHVTDAVMRSVNQSVDSIKYLVFKTPFWLIIFSCVMIGIFIGGGKWFHKILACKIIIMYALLPVVTYFPVFLAYSNSEYFPNRCEFVGILVCIFSIMTISILTGVFLKESKIITGYKEGVIIMLFLCLLLPVINNNYKYSNTLIYRMCSNGSIEQFKKYHDSAMAIYHQIGEAQSSDVIIESLPEPVPDFRQINLSTDPGYWINQGVAKYYNKNSVAVKSK